MCGILLYFSNKKITLDKFEKSLNLQSHRGPDHTGIYFNKHFHLSHNQIELANYSNDYGVNKNNIFSNLFIGHKRLSVFDLSSRSNQPFINKNLKDFFIYNGEFYNFKDYATKENINSDGLTLFENINNFGIDFYNNVNGMWASVHSNFKDNKIYLSRDRYGKKPLFYYHSKDTFIVSSEIKSIFSLIQQSRKINLEGLAHFFTTKMSPFFTDGSTFYKNIFSVKPGHNLFLDLNNFQLKCHSILDHIGNRKKPFKNIKDIENSFKTDFENAVYLRLQTDRKVALLLSGGIDSSLISSFIKKKDLDYLSFYTIDSNTNKEENLDLYYANILSNHLGVKINKISCDLNYNEFNNIMYTLTTQQENPLNFFSTAIPTYLISSRMKKDNIHIALDGVGGDEVMGGFPKYASLAIASLKKNNYLKSIKYFEQFIKYNDYNFFTNLKYFCYIFYSGIINNKYMSNSQNNSLNLCNYLINDRLNEQLKKNIFENAREKLSEQIERQHYEISKGGLPYYLGVSDSSNMINTVESRSPFLDTNINKYLNIPDNMKFQNGYNKFLLRKILSDRAPKQIAWRKNKYGFTTFGSEKFMFNKNSLEKIFDSQFVRNIINKKVNFEILQKNKYLTRNLLSLAILDDIYKLDI